MPPLPRVQRAAPIYRLWPNPRFERTDRQRCWRLPSLGLMRVSRRNKVGVGRGNGALQYWAGRCPGLDG